MKRFLLSLSTFLGVSCTTPQESLPKVPSVDLPRYMGDWYVIASIPTFLEVGAHNALEQYDLQADGNVAIRFTFNKDSFDGKKKELTMTGIPVEGTNGSEWRIRPFWPLSFPYVIVDLAPDYEWVVVAMPNRKNFWIMARKPALDEALVTKLIDKMSGLGFPRSEVKFVPQKTY